MAADPLRSSGDVAGGVGDARKRVRVDVDGTQFLFSSSSSERSSALEQTEAPSATTTTTTTTTAAARSATCAETIVPLIDEAGRFIFSLVPSTPELTPLASLFLDAWGMNAYVAHKFVPCMHPASLSRVDLRTVQQQAREGGVMCSRKSDGVRMQWVLYNTVGGAQMSVLVDRQFRLHVITEAPSTSAPSALASNFLPYLRAPAMNDIARGGITVIDAELVVATDDVIVSHHEDRTTSSSSSHSSSSHSSSSRRVRREVLTHSRAPTLVCHDVVCLKGVSLTNAHFSTRIRILSSFVSALSENSIRAGVRVVAKPWFSSVRECVRSDIAHAEDGLIVALREGTLRNGISSCMFKWKLHHTVDLFVAPGSGELLATDGNRSVLLRDVLHDADVRIDQASFAPFASSRGVLDAARPDTSWMSSYQSVVERCVVVEADLTRDATSGVIVISALKLRTDKPLCNDMRVIRRTLDNVREDIRLTELLSEGEEDSEDEAAGSESHVSGGGGGGGGVDTSPPDRDDLVAV